jgi:hypothetical protein
MPQQLVDVLTGTSETTVDWRRINMNSELVASSLTSTLGPGYSMIRKHWKFNAKEGDGTVPLNHILRFQTFGEPCPLGITLRQDSRVRLVATRNDDGTLKRGHLVLTGDLFKKDDDTKRVGRSEFWLALTRPFGPPGKRTPPDVPEGLKIMKEYKPAEDDLGSRDIEDYRCRANGGTLIQETQTVVFHLDQSDQYRHINTNKYMDRALDLLALQCHGAGGDVGHLRFHEITIYFRKPFVPGDVADVDSDFVLHKDSFHGAVRFYHSNDGTRSERISMALETRGPLVDD